MRIRDIPKENRPRERLEMCGAEALSDAELLAAILRTGNKDENVIDVSNRLISRYGLAKLSELSLDELRKIKGIGDAKACQIIALFEFSKRHSLAKQRGKQISCAEDVYEYCSPRLSGKDKEHFIALHLDTKNRITKYDTLSVGILNSSLIHPREVFKSAIKESANSIILVHNHPSGDPEPSDEDKEITEKIIHAGKILGIEVLDHVIVGAGCWYSFRDN